MSRLSPLGVYLRGVLMGAADIVPGVSGGTIAFITGIYDTLLASIRCFDLELLARLFRLDIKGAWQHVNGGFLLALLAGIGTTRRWPADAEVVERAVSRPLFRELKNPAIRLILERLEIHSRSKKSEDTQIPAGLQIEHVLPQSWTQAWPLRKL